MKGKKEGKTCKAGEKQGSSYCREGENELSCGGGERSPQKSVGNSPGGKKGEVQAPEGTLTRGRRGGAIVAGRIG